MKCRMAILSLAVLAMMAVASDANAGGRGEPQSRGHRCWLPGVDWNGNLNLALGGWGTMRKRKRNGSMCYTCTARVKNFSRKSWSDNVKMNFGGKRISARLYISRPRRGFKAYARLTFCIKRGKGDNGQRPE